MPPGGASSSRKGTRYESELRDTLEALSFGVVRIGASGGGGDQDLPDILASQPIHDSTYVERIYADAMAVELKCGDGTTLYVDEDEVDALQRFARAFGATAYLGARFTTQSTSTDYYLVPPERARKTDSGAYGLPVADIEERAAVTIHPGDEPAVEGVDHA